MHVTIANFDFLSSLLSEEDESSSSQQSSDSSILRYALAKDASLIIFYNLYIPNDEEGIKNAINVIKDQIGQIASVLTRIEKENKSTKNQSRGVVLYNLIGNEHAYSTNDMKSLCHKLHPRLDCQLLEFHKEASEAVTLQDVHDYCHSGISYNQNATRVTYLHSKGSYHSQDTNHIWRRQMTDAALHPQCLNPPNNTCDVCSAQFYIKYAIMFPGNMWSAKCQYIRKLISPNTGEYTKRKRASIKQFLILRTWGILHATLDTDSVEHYGLDRYQWEHWITHPSIQPCELHTTDVPPLILLGRDPKGRTMSPKYYDWGMAPRRADQNLGGQRGPRLRIEASKDRQFREYYFIPGNLLKWMHIYGKDGIPSQDSWIWKSFMAGQEWKHLVRDHGADAIDVMVKESKPTFHSAFDTATNHSKAISMSKNNEEDTTALSAKLFGEAATPPVLVVFYQISFPDVTKQNYALKAVQAQFDILHKGQYDNVTNSYDTKSRILLYYTISGGTTQQIDAINKQCKEKADRIICRQLGKYDTEGITGEILHHIYTFCINKPSSYNVIHITNRLPGHESYKTLEKSYDVSRIQAITTAVISTMCHQQHHQTTSSNDIGLGNTTSCNVCGTEFFPLPFFQFTGNMFSTTCGYINNLLPPSTFEVQMNDIAQDALIYQIEEIYTTKLIAFNQRILGSYQHSVEHWIGSHPDLRPCDVAPINTEKYGTLSSDMTQYSWSMAPGRRGSAPPGTLTLEEAEESKFRQKRDVALHEYYYLAGNVLRWHRLYDKIPNSNSWVWQWFPDGQLWETAAKSGEAAVDHLLGLDMLEKEGGRDALVGEDT